jgi:hypothetical protein
VKSSNSNSNNPYKTTLTIREGKNNDFGHTQYGTVLNTVLQMWTIPGETEHIQHKTRQQCLPIG